MIFDELEDVYFTQEVPHSGQIKIGYSKWADTRMTNYHSTNWRELKVVRVLALPPSLAQPFEQFLHRKLKSVLRVYEWFDLEVEHIDPIIAHAMKDFFNTRTFEDQDLLAAFIQAPIEGELYRRLSRPHSSSLLHKRWRDTQAGYERHLQAQKEKENELPYFLHAPDA